MNVAGWLAKAALQYGHRHAVLFGRTRMTYASLAERSGRLAAALTELGLAPGDRLALLQKNGPEFVESLFGAWMAGLVVVPINSRAHSLEAAHIIDSSGAGAVIVGAEYQRELLSSLSPEVASRLISLSPSDGPIRYEELMTCQRPVVEPAERRPDDLAWLFYTSGTTGKPKGAMLSHRNLRQMVMSHLADVRSFRPGEVVLHAAPLTHGSGLVLLACVARGASNLIYDGRSFDAAVVLELLQRQEVASIAFLAPTQIVALNAVAAECPKELSLESVCYGGAPMFTDDLRRALSLFGPVFVQIYGQGEAPMTITVLGQRDHVAFHRSGDPRLGSVGMPRTDVEVAVVDASDRPVPVGEPGEVVVRGDVVMLGYWRNRIATSDTLRSGWLRTGDVGVFDDSGYVFLLDRSKDLIISGGANIYPREVEEAILAMPEVAQAAVIGLPDPYWGESVHALVVPQDGERLSDEVVIHHCQTMLASYKKPRTVEFVAQLPVNAYGKVMKRELRASRISAAGSAPGRSPVRNHTQGSPSLSRLDSQRADPGRG